MSGREAILVKGPAAQLVVYRAKSSNMQRSKSGRASWKRWPQAELHSGLILGKTAIPAAHLSWGPISWEGSF